jgi:HEAT repeat protein
MSHDLRPKTIGLATILLAAWTSPQGSGHTKDVDLLISDLRQGNGEIRAYAADALGKIKDARSVDLLIQALRDDDWNIRFGAKMALVEIGKPSVSSLIEALKENDSRVRANAAEALGKDQ